jgi:hypothetical protein
MKKHLLFLLLAMSLPLFAQNTYTTSQDAGGGKQYQYITANVTNGTSNPFQLKIDSRAIYFPSAHVWILAGIYPNQTDIFDTYGTITGFVANPDGTHNSFYGVASFESGPGYPSASGTFQYYAYYASTCSGRGCGGTLGWHYRILLGSTFTVE